MLKIYNSQSKKKESFSPITPGKIGLYVCGITVYDFCHIGHARVFVSFDTITRFLRWQGWEVNYIQNITDIDDKIIHRANENNETIASLTERFIAAMNEDMTQLNVLSPSSSPRATHYIEHMLEMIEKLENKGVAYQGDNGDVFFSVDQDPHYGTLSKRDLKDMVSGSRVEVDLNKKNPLDFVLWKKTQNENEPSWPSKWGNGRPGWHIECSAMSTTCLGNHFDIHGGGHDLLFPHHENERAQSECATGESFTNYWMHVGFVQVNKEKMSKSLGNFFTIREVLKQYSAEVVRLFLISSHYRSPVNFSHEQLENASISLTRLYTALRYLPLEDKCSPDKFIKETAYYQQFCEAMNDDFNTSEALAVLFNLAHDINTLKSTDNEKATQFGYLLLHLGQVLGILTQDIESFFKGEINSSRIETLIKARQLAKNNKNWKDADLIRSQLEQEGVMLEDKPGGITEWRLITTQSKS